jgi:hypothetical protein
LSEKAQRHLLRFDALKKAESFGLWLYLSPRHSRDSVTNSSRILASLLRRVLDFLACFLDACANVVDSVVNAATSAFHRASRTMTADDRQCQYNQCEDAFHVLKYNLVVRDFNSQQIGLEILSARSQGARPSRSKHLQAAFRICAWRRIPRRVTRHAGGARAVGHGAESELVCHGHEAFRHPAAVREIQRILRVHSSNL